MPIVFVFCLIIMTEYLNCKFLRLLNLSPSDSAAARVLFCFSDFTFTQSRDIAYIFRSFIWQKCMVHLSKPKPVSDPFQ